MNEELKALDAIEDPLIRAKTANALIGQYAQWGVEATRVRNEAMQEVIASKRMTDTALGAELGMTKGRVSQIKKGTDGPPVHRAFLGTGSLVVALGGKTEERPKHDPLVAPVVATEDYRTFEHLRDFAASMQLDAVYEVIAPPGIVNLNRDNLIVVCGPRLSPLIQQILESDPNLKFAKDDEGWRLEDHSNPAGVTVYRSPMDHGEHGDYAYFGRLPRPDGKGTFLYIAGIHAIGSSGVVHWLTAEIADAYKSLKTKRFSTLIHSSFNPETREITGSTRVTPLYRYEGA